MDNHPASRLIPRSTRVASCGWRINSMFDLCINNTRIIDTEKERITVGNICISDGKIAEITREYKEAREVIDAGGRHISPGFIDIHTHIEGNNSAGELICRQGVTTVVNGNCGIGPDDLSSFIHAQRDGTFIVNQIEIAGATILRKRVGVTDPHSPMTDEQLSRAESLLTDLFTAGAAGLSFGLEYQPGTSTEEIMRLSRVAARYGKSVSVHTRADHYAGLAALDEAISINRITGAPVQISHVVYQYGFGMMRASLDMIDDAISRGYDISCDSGMYTSFATYIGTEVFAPACFGKWGRSYDAIYMSSGPYAGRRLDEESYLDVRKNHPDDVAIALVGNPHEIDMAFDLPYMMVSSDAGVNQTGDPSCGHPQDAGTFPRFLARTVRETGRLTLVDAIRRITILPAERMGLSTKGRIRVGCDADLVIFDPDTVRDCARFPHEGACDAPPDGIHSVIVNGRIAVRGNGITNHDAGKMITFPMEEWRY